MINRPRVDENAEPLERTCSAGMMAKVASPTGVENSQTRGLSTTPWRALGGSVRISRAQWTYGKVHSRPFGRAQSWKIAMSIGMRMGF